MNSTINNKPYGMRAVAKTSSRIVSKFTGKNKASDFFCSSYRVRIISHRINLIAKDLSHSSLPGN